ncbi:MAG: PAS domain-containing sensor histidine kinase [Hyphomicrobiales bacterium]|nr:PAS domain-containing sensor histidine kinase [Hyphomicrobiales bacterium]
MRVWAHIIKARPLLSGQAPATRTLIVTGTGLAILLTLTLVTGWGLLIPASLRIGMALACLAWLALTARQVQILAAAPVPAAGPDPLHMALMNQLVDGLVIEHGADGHVIRVLAAASEEFGVPAQAWSGPGLFNRLHVADRPDFLRSIAQARAGAAVSTVTVRLRLDARDMVAEAGQDQLHHFDGSNGPVAAPVFAPVDIRITRIETAGRASYLSFLRNRSEIVALEQARSSALAQIGALEQWRGRLLANVSHELRTPLNAIIGFADILKEGLGDPPDAAKQREFAGIISDSGRHLLSLVNSILDMSKIEAGRLALTPEPLALLPLLAECCDMFQIEAAQRRLVLARDWSESPGLSDVDMMADKRALRQIIINLMGNATKFTPNGGTIMLSARRQGNFVRLSLRDNGIGMASEDLHRLGEPFFQAASNYDRAHEGTGLGLALVRGLVGLHGGSLRIESTQGEGTCVSLLLPWDGARVGTGDAAIEIVTGPLPRHGYASDFFPDQYRMRKSA